MLSGRSEIGELKGLMLAMMEKSSNSNSNNQGQGSSKQPTLKAHQISFLQSRTMTWKVGALR